MKFLNNLFSQWWAYIKSYRHTYIPDNPITSTVQEDTRAKESVKRFNKSFEQQQQSLNIRALKPHECADPLTCEKDKCFTWKPDKIVRTMKVRSLRRKK